MAFAQPKARLEYQRFIEVFDDESFRRLIEAEEEGERQKQREKEKEEEEIEGDATS